MKYEIKTHDFKYETVEQAKDLLNDLEKNKHIIIILNLSHNTFYPEVFTEMAKKTMHMKNLNELNLESTLSCLTLEHMIEICKTISKFVPKTITSFNMSANALSCNIPNEWCTFLSECTELRELNLYNCGLGHDGIVKLLKKLDGKCKKLNALNIGKNRINTLNKELGKIVGQFECLTELRLAHNTVSEGFDEFLTEITQNLQVLDITDNFVEEVSGLTQILNKKTLKEIHLRDIKTDDMLPILEIIHENVYDSLTVLDVSQNDMFEEECLVLLLEIVKKNKNLSKLIIYDNFYETEFATKFEDLKSLVKTKGVFVDENSALIEDLLIEKFSRI